VETFDGVAIAECGDVLLVVWKSDATLARYDWFEPRVFAMAERHESIAICQFILSSSRPPDAALRARLRATLVRLGPRMRRLVSVPIGDAIWLTLVRGIMRGMAILSGQSGAVFVAANVESALDRIAQVRTADTPSRDVLAGTAEESARALGVHLQRVRER
jgi:hypothetical protein